MPLDKYSIHPALFISELYKFFEEYYAKKHNRAIVITLSDKLLKDMANAVMSYQKSEIKINCNFKDLYNIYPGFYVKDNLFIITKPCISDQDYPTYLYSNWKNTIKDAMLDYMYNNELSNIVNYVTKAERLDLEIGLSALK